MTKAKILIVEDDWIVAEDIKSSLKKLGFTVSGIVAYGEKALEKVKECQPDLVLMDIMLKGEMNGTEAADQIQSQLNIPIVYLTAYTDDDVLERAKETEPFGYVVKPFEDRELSTAIEIALYKHKMETKLKQSEAWLSTTLKSIGDAVIATDAKGFVTFVNPIAQSLTGWNEDAIGKSLNDVFNIINEETRKPVENPVDKAIGKSTIVGLANHTILIAKDGKEIPIDDSGAPIRDEKGSIIGVVLVFRDITERKQAAETLERDRNMLQEVMNGARNIHLVYLDLNFNFIQVNQAYAATCGYQPEEMVGKNHFALYPHPENEAIFARVRDTGIPFEIKDKPFSFPDQPERGVTYWDWSLLRVKEPDGTVTGLVLSLVETTKRKRAEEELRRLATVVMDSNDAITVQDTEGNITAWNKSAEKMFGYSETEALSMNIKDIVPDDKKKEALSFVQKLQEEEVESFETQRMTKEGRLLDVWLTVTKLVDDQGKTFAIATTERDITENKQAIKELRESEELYRTLIETSIDGIVLTGLDGTYLFCNQRQANLLGYDSKDDLIGRNGFDFIAQENEETAQKIFQKLMDEKHVEDVRLEVIRKDGVRMTTEFSATVIDDKKGTYISIMCLMKDITERKRLEEQLRQVHKMESIGTLAGGIAHDFNNILYMITGNAELALEDIPEWNPVHVNLEEIKTAGLRAAGIVKQLLTFSRKADQEMKPIGAITVIKDILKFLRSTIPKTIEFRMHIPDTDVAILADPIQINQVLMNIFTNASQAMEATGGILEITVENETLIENTVGKHPDLAMGDYLKITVSDSGPGIDPEIIDRIFDPYFTTKDVGKGSGMGLSVVYGIVKKHNGAITVESELGKGANFSILFPMITEIIEAEIKTTDELLLGTETILFVDDEKSITNMAGQMLERLGYKVETRLNPIETFELFQSKPHKFDLVITDMTMPQMTGVKLLEKLKEIRSDIPVIICTGDSSLIDEKKAKELGLSGYVMKPIVKQEIAKTIREALDNK